ncbi:hypothetical protein PGT21_020818 [Puccinia graminis f. sp. tritici]|uniref:BD-FAE-like domain-containing protein n=1 Tax=Puccinia graminis f. sp. tritici TaxID=56615 RepID=A0A5B0PRL9_PUCGR|nr:hypothetical protein PGTUg99_031744 [Puccinia graminis f. sp. tritici]KAA1104365.1 hypothetical protein PGT21_020818 [Puccinia graminis f. sp. tritici]
MSIEEQNNNNLPPSSSEEQEQQEQDYYYYYQQQQQQQAVLPITPVQRPSLIRWMLCLLVPALLLCSILSPLSLFLSLFPITLIFGLPIWISSTLLLCLSLAWIPYLLFAQEDRPTQTSILLPLSPLKILRIINTLIKHAIILLRSNWLELILDYSYRKIIVLGRNNSPRSSRPTIVCRDLIYAYSDDHHEHRPATRKSNQRLDVYLPTTSSSAGLAPVFLFIHPGGWRWFEKSLFLQIGLRFRRLGFCVVVPDFTQFPDGRCQDSVRDIRCVLRWVASSIREYGGDPERIFVAGHGSGAHLSMLTVVRSAIGRSLALQAYPSSVPPIFQQQQQEEEEALPMIEGMILLSGIYDPINQLRDEARAGWLDILASRRALGPSHPSSLANSPAHLLHHALPFLEPRYLPAKFLIIHGGTSNS